MEKCARLGGLPYPSAGTCCGDPRRQEQPPRQQELHHDFRRPHWWRSLCGATRDPEVESGGTTPRTSLSKAYSSTPNRDSASSLFGNTPPKHGRASAGRLLRILPEANNEEKRILRDLGFRVPGQGEIRQMRETCRGQPRRKETSSGPSRSSRSGQSTRRSLWKAAAALSIMFTTALSIMTEFACEALPEVEAPEVALLEIGEVTATCRFGRVWWRKVEAGRAHPPRGPRPQQRLC